MTDGFDYVAAERAHAFNLVQRLDAVDHAGRKGFDALFRGHYMGSAEYEWGAMAGALRFVRERGDVRIVTTTVAGRNVHVVGPAELLQARVADLRLWVADGASSRDGSWFTHALGIEPDRGNLRVDAWWALSAGIAWTLDEAVAHRLVTAFAPPTDRPETARS